MAPADQHVKRFPNAAGGRVYAGLLYALDVASSLRIRMLVISESIYDMMQFTMNYLASIATYDAGV